LVRIVEWHFNPGSPDCAANLARSIPAFDGHGIEAMISSAKQTDIAAVRARQRTQRAGWPADWRWPVDLLRASPRTARRYYAGWGIPMVPGHEQANARMTPDGGLEIRVGVHSHGQGLETTLGSGRARNSGARYEEGACRAMAIPPSTPYSTGTWGLALDGHGRWCGWNRLR